jgi:hypothetical protein
MTNTVTYTPGPWDCDLDYIVAPDPNGRHPGIYIAEIADSDEEGRIASLEQQIANRQLITAAPELLEALIDLLGDQPSVQHGQCLHCERDYRDTNPDFEIETGDCLSGDCPSYKARAAIAKARRAASAPNAAAIVPVLAVTVRGGLIDDMNATSPVHVVVEDWDVPDEDRGKKPTRSVWKLVDGLSPKKAAELRRLIAND